MHHPGPEVDRPPSDSSHPLLYDWTWYAHVHAPTSKRAPSREQRYKDGYLPLGSAATIEDFWRYFNSLPCVSLFSTSRIAVNSTASLTAFSLFREGVRPQWEDDLNREGGEVTCRGSLPPSSARALWTAVLVEAVRGERECITGVRFVHKGSHCKVEVWYGAGSAPEEVDALEAWMGEESLRCGGGPPVRVMHAESLSRQATAVGRRRA